MNLLILDDHGDAFIDIGMAADVDDDMVDDGNSKLMNGIFLLF